MKYYILKTLGYFVKTIFIKYMRDERGDRVQSFADRPTKAGGDERKESLNSARRVLASRGVGSLASYRSPESA